MKDLINQRLSELMSELRVMRLVSIDDEEIVRRSQKFSYAELSNGFIFQSLAEYQKFKRRVMTGSYDFHLLYHPDENVRDAAEADLRSSKASKNALAGWKQIPLEKRHDIASNRAKKAWSEGKLTIPCKGWNKGLTKETSLSIKKMAECRTGASNPMSRESTQNWNADKVKSYRKKLSASMKLAIEEGRFTPNVHNSNTNWTANYAGKKFRSALEAAFAAALGENFLFEETRIRYQDGDEDHIYIVDFISHHDRKLIEVKPESMIAKAELKTIAGQQYASMIGYGFEILTEKDLQRHADKLLSVKHKFSPETWNKIERYLEINS